MPVPTSGDAASFKSIWAWHSPAKTLDLAKVQAAADAIIADEEVPPDAVYEQDGNLLLVGTSMGGARPEAVVEDADGLWIANSTSGPTPGTARVPRNHALIAKDTDWKLSPAYDLTPAVPVSIERRDLAMEMRRRRQVRERIELLSQSARFLLDRAEAIPIIDTMEAQVRGVMVLNRARCRSIANGLRQDCRGVCL